MADLKISQLTAASTPLAGTEVLPIVQSSTTKKVSVADLTAGRALTASTLALNGTLPGDSKFYVNASTGNMKARYDASSGTGSCCHVFVNTAVSTVGTENSTGGTLVASSSAYATVIANNGAYEVQLGTNNTVRTAVDSSGNLYPIADNAYTAGKSGKRWSAVWAANGTIQTSDERQKTEIVESDLGLDFINALRPVSYKFKVGANVVNVIDKGVDDEGNRITETVVTPRAGVRSHYGLIAQEVKAIVGDKDFGGYVHDQEADEIGLRYDEFIAPLIKAVQQLSARVAELEKAQQP